jgi:ribosomal protein S8
MGRLISPSFVSEFKYVFGRIREALAGDIEKIYLVKRKNYYNIILDLFVREGFIRGYKEFNEVLIIYFIRSGIRKQPLVSITSIRWLHRRPSLRAKDISRWKKRSGTAVLILNTDMGMLTANEAIRNQVGGFPIFKIT